LSILTRHRAVLLTTDQDQTPPGSSPGEQPTVDGPRSCTTVAIAIGRLDERLRASGDVIREGWIARTTLAETAASSMLEGQFIHADDLALFEAGGASRIPDPVSSRALQNLRLLRRLLARKPRRIFTPQRLLHRIGKLASSTLSLDEIDPIDRQDAVFAALENVFGPAATAKLDAAEPLLSAASILAAWHADRLLSGDLGRALTMQWLRYHGITTRAPLFSSIGFVGAAAEYRPWAKDWPGFYVSATGRATRFGLGLAARLERSAAALAAIGADRRRNSTFPQFTAYAIKAPLLSAPLAASHLGISIQAALKHLDRLREAKAIRPVTERRSFRFFELAL
jgi:hypothetical protein